MNSQKPSCEHAEADSVAEWARYSKRLWGYYTNQVLLNEAGEAAACEIGWLADQEYNDFACLLQGHPWTQADRTGELLRIEAKSMNAGAEESKAHFEELYGNLAPWDLLLVLVWSWDPADHFRVYPHILDHYIGFARSVAMLRDALHLARGGFFVCGPIHVLSGGMFARSLSPPR